MNELGIINQFIIEHPLVFLVMIVWSLIWKGLALWRSAELGQKWWFIVLLVVNSLGILEIIYIYLIVRKYEVEVIEKNG